MNDFSHFQDIKFVGDDPASSDEFEGGAHARVAETLTHIIVSSDGGKAVGLEGTWGSGKSTVIDLAKRIFEKRNNSNKNKHVVFIFDAWAHQGDPLRRVFLDSLIAELTEKVIDKTKWEKKLEELRSLKKKVTESRAEKLSWVARISLLVLPFFPLAYLLLAEALKAPSATVALPILGSWSKGVVAFASLLILFAPYIALLFTWLSRLKKEEFKGKSIIVAFNRQTDHVTTEQLIREDEATTVEFNLVFDEILKDTKEAGRTLVIVLDNLDRLANDQIRDIWATMRNFFAATPGSKRREILRNVWLIVPIDRQHIESVFADSSQGEGDQSTRGFVEKTFEIILRVPPPLLSNWREFFSKKLLEAFGKKISASEIYQIFRLLELHLAVHPRPITPRAIKSHVNKIVAQAKLSGSTIPLEYQALYVLYKDAIAADIKKLQNSSILDSAIRSTINEPDWTKYLAAAHFNVPPESALELLLAQDVESALLAQDTARLRELAKTNGFSLILHNVVSSARETWAAESPTIYFDVARTLSELEMTDTAAVEHIWRDYVGASSRLGKAIIPTDLTKDGIAALVNRASQARRPALVDAILSVLAIQRGDLKDGFEQAGLAWFLMVEALIGTYKKFSPETANQVSKNIPIQANVPFFLGVAERVSNSTVLSLSDFSIPLSAADITSALVAFIDIPEPSEKLESIVKVLLTAPKRVDWTKLSAAIQNRIQQNSPKLNATGAKRLLSLLHMCRDHGPAKDALKAVIDDGSIQGIIEIGRLANDKDLMVLAIDKLIDLKKTEWVGPADQPQYGSLAELNEYLKKFQTNPKSEPDLLSALSRWNYQLGGFNQTLKLAVPNDKNREVFREMFRTMIDFASENNVDLPFVTQNYDRISSFLGSVDVSRLLTLAKQVNFDEALASSPDNWKQIRPGFVQQLASIDASRVKDLAEVIEIEADKLSKEDWAGLLQSEGNELALLLDLIDLNELHPRSPAFLDALRLNLSGVIDGQIIPKTYAQRWRYLPKALSDAHRPFFFKGVRDDLLNSSPSAEIVVRVLKLLGPEFLASAQLSERDASTVVRTLIDPLIADHGDEAIECLMENSGSLRPIIDHADAQTISFVVDRFSDVLSKADEQLQPKLLNVAKSLGIKGDFPKHDSSP